MTQDIGHSIMSKNLDPFPLVFLAVGGSVRFVACGEVGGGDY